MAVVRELFATLGLKTDETGFKHADELLGGLKHALIGLGVAFAAGAAAKGLAHIVDETANAAVEANKAAQRTGVTREAYEELAFAAHHSGTSAEAFEQGLKHLNLTMYAAGKGSGDTAKAFSAMGVHIKRGASSADEVLVALADRFAAMPEGNEKIALATKIFGRALGTEMLPMLNKGSTALKALREEAHKTGMVFADEDVKAARDYKRASMDLTLSLEVLQRAIGVPLLHVVAEQKKALAEWIEKNRDLVRTKVTEWVDRLIAAWKRAKATLEPLTKAVGAIVSQTWLWEAAATALSLVLVSQLGLAIAGAVAKAGAWLTTLRAITAAQVTAAASTFLWGLAVIAGIALVVLGMEELYGWITGDRETLLGNWLGTFQNLLKVNAADSAFVKGLKVATKAIVDFLDVREQLDHLLAGEHEKFFAEQKADQGAMGKAFEAAGAGGPGQMERQWELAKNARFTELARAGDYAALQREFGKGGAPAVAPGAVAASAPEGLPAAPAIQHLTGFLAPPTTVVPTPSVATTTSDNRTINMTFGNIVTPDPDNFLDQIRRLQGEDTGAAFAAVVK